MTEIKIPSIARNFGDSNSIGGTKKTASAAVDTKTNEAARDFEALLVKEMLESMWATVPSQGGILGGSKEEEYYRDMLNQGLAKNIADGAGIGIKDVIYKDIKKLDDNQK